jgi:hypothetical protein
MDMAAALGRRDVPVALVIPFDGTKTLYAPANVARVVNLTQRNYAYARGGAGFHGSLANVDVSFDKGIDHINIDKAARTHARAISEVLAVVGHPSPPPKGQEVAKPAAAPADDTSAARPAPADESPSRPAPSPAAASPAPAAPASAAPAPPAPEPTAPAHSGAASPPAVKPAQDASTGSLPPERPAQSAAPMAKPAPAKPAAHSIEN